MFSSDHIYNTHHELLRIIGYESGNSEHAPPSFEYDFKAKTAEEFVTALNQYGAGDYVIYQLHELNEEALKESYLTTPFLIISEHTQNVLYVKKLDKDGFIGISCIKGDQQERYFKFDEIEISAIVTFHQTQFSNTLKEPDKKVTPIKRLFTLLASQKNDIYMLYFYGIVVGLLSLILPLTIQSVTGLISGGMLIQPVIILILVAVLATAASGFVQILQMTIIEAIQRRIFTRTSLELAFKLPRFDLSALLDQYTPELVNRFFDVLTLQKSISKLLVDFVTFKLVLLFGLLLLAIYHPYFIFFSLLLIGVLALLFYVTGPRGLQSSLEESKYKYKLVFWLEELARTMHTFKLSGSHDISTKKTKKYLTGYLTKRKLHFKVLITQFTSLVIFKTLVTASTLILGTVLVVNAEITLGQFVASEIIIITILNAVEKFISSFEVVYDMLTALEKIAQLTEKPIERQSGLILKKDKFCNLEFKNLNFRYTNADRTTLKDINLRIEKNEIVGIVGNEGSGKSTLLRIIAGLLTDYDGAFTINGISLRDVQLSSYREKVGDNLASDTLFNGTIRENIGMGKKKITADKIYWALEKVGLSDYVAELDNGLDTELISGGQGLSSGISRRMILARCLASQPHIMVFDEFYGYLPGTQKKQFLDTVCSPNREWSIIAASHDLRFLARCDKIYVLDKGKIDGVVDFDELLSNPKYSTWFQKPESNN